MQLLADYYPLTPRSNWQYDVTEGDGDESTLNVNIGRKTRSVGGRPASRVIYDYEGDRVDTLQSFDRDGKLRIHAGSFDGIKAVFGSGITIPRVLKAGYIKRSSGDLNLEYSGFEGDGNWTSRVVIGKASTITVPAGTFKTIRMKIDIDFEAEEDIAFGVGPEAEGRVTLILHLAKGVGVVQARQSYELDADIIVDNRNESGSATQQLRSYDVRPAAQAASLATRSLFGVRRIKADSVL